ncbi:TetR/AcrR family transcriptional regulator [Dialister sp.]|uniref:TetR/AcrR family transcriptional regulator n=1 Tax=Dialister sp. TaxID=1955814 RepID=UPI003F12A2B8
MALTKKAERTKAKLLDSAKKLISERGFDHVSVEDITRDSGVAKGTFYHYFKCKEDVVAELSFQSAQSTINKAIHFEGSVSERCFYYFTEICRDAEWTGIRLVRQWLRETMEQPAENSEAKDALFNIYNAVISIYEAHQGEGPGELTKDAPLDTLAKLMMSHLIGVLTVWCMMNASFSIVGESTKYMKIDIENLLDPFIIK